VQLRGREVAAADDVATERLRVGWPARAQYPRTPRFARQELRRDAAPKGFLEQFEEAQTLGRVAKQQAPVRHPARRRNAVEVASTQSQRSIEDEIITRLLPNRSAEREGVRFRHTVHEAHENVLCVRACLLGWEGCVTPIALSQCEPVRLAADRAFQNHIAHLKL